MVRLMEVKGRGLKIVWYDKTKGAGQAGKRWVDVLGGDHKNAWNASGWTEKEREAFIQWAEKQEKSPKKSTQHVKRLMDAYVTLERDRAIEHTIAPTDEPDTDHNQPISELVDAYVRLLEYRAGQRATLDDTGLWRQPVVQRRMAASTLVNARYLFAEFKKFIGKHTTGDITLDLIQDYFQQLGQEKYKPAHGEARRRSNASINYHRTNVRAFFGAFRRSAIEKFFREDPKAFFGEDGEIGKLPEPHHETEVYSADQVQSFLKCALQLSDPNRVAEYTRTKHGKKEAVAQRVNFSPAVLPLGILLACTGMRRGEALILKWEQVKLEEGILRIVEPKNNRIRTLPLIGDRLGDVSPTLLAWLKARKDAFPKAPFVLPINGELRPAYAKHGWMKAAASNDVLPQGLRRTFEGFLARAGIPPAIAALWMGHSSAVADKHYHGYQKNVCAGSTVEEMLGIKAIIEADIARLQALTS